MQGLVTPYFLDCFTYFIGHCSELTDAKEIFQGGWVESADAKDNGCQGSDTAFKEDLGFLLLDIIDKEGKGCVFCFL